MMSPKDAIPRWTMLVLCLAAAVVTGCGGNSLDANDASDINNDPLRSITADELHRRGMLLAHAGDYVRAEQYLAAALDRGFDEERTLPALLNVCIRASRLVAALEYAEPYLARHPEQWPLRLLVGTIQMGLSEPERARTEFERVLVDAAPEEPPEAHYFLGVVYRDALEDEEASAAHFRRYLVIQPEGQHAEEARAALSPEERGLPQRVERTEVPPAPETEPTETEPTEADSDDSAPPEQAAEPPASEEASS